MTRRSGYINWIVGGIIVILVIAAAIYGLVAVHRVEPGEVGVIITYRQGDNVLEKPVIEIAPVAQWFIISPVTQRVAKYPTRQQTLQLIAIIENNSVIGGDAAKCSDSGGIPLWINTTVLWRVDPDKVGDLYLLRPGYQLDTGNDDVEADDGDIEAEIVYQKLIGAITDACGEYTYDAIFGESRTPFSDRVAELLTKDLETSFIILDDFIMGEINSTNEIEASLSGKSAAQQVAAAAEYDADAARTTAQGQADAAVIAAQGRADALRLEAQAQAEAIKITADAEAEAIVAISDALAEYGVTLVEWQWLENWDGHTPQTLVISDDAGSPLLTIELEPEVQE